MPFHLYLHMPYCRRKCPYCDFFKQVPRAGERQQFHTALLKEMKLAAQTYEWATGSPATIYFGGGTPSLHSAEEIAEILSHVKTTWPNIEENPRSQIPNPKPQTQSVSSFKFQVSSFPELTLETNPGTVNLQTLQGYRAAGVNRLSIGAQSFHARKLALLYRDHVAQETRECVEMARRAGFENLSLDLIFGLPGETLEEWNQDIYHALALNPEHVSLYNLEFHEGTPFWRWKRTGRLSPLDPDLEAEMYLMTHEILTEHGFLHYEVSNFAQPGFQSVHNSAYWQGKPYLGLGPSAHSFDGRMLRIENVADMYEYFRALRENRLPVAKAGEVDEPTRKEDWIGLQLRRSEGITYADAVQNLGAKETVQLWERAAQLPKDSRELTADYFRLTAAGWFRENSVMGWVTEERMKDGL